MTMILLLGSTLSSAERLLKRIGRGSLSAAAPDDGV
jgi:hypothetical protein